MVDTLYRIHTQASSKRSAGFRADIMRISESGGGGVRVWFRGCASCCLRSALQIPTTMLVFESLQAQTRGRPRDKKYKCVKFILFFFS